VDVTIHLADLTGWLRGSGLAYVIRAWLGDGRLARDRRKYEYYVKLEVSDYDFAEEWGRRLAEALGRSKPYTPRWDDNDQRWVVKRSSALLYDLLKRAREGDPWILMPYLEKYPAEACRGSFDAEGSVNINRYQIEACNTNSRTIGLFEGLLGKLGIDCRMHKFRWDEFMKCPKTGKLYRRNSGSIMCLAIYGEENILRFAERVGFTIARKRAALMKLVRRYRGC
jgi:intein-encoded DNA endonuclease-like protein